jgi:hypothetical protein
MRNTTKVVLAVAALILRIGGHPSPADAATITNYGSQAVFDAAAANETFGNFEAFSTNPIDNPIGYSLTTNGATFTGPGARLFMIGPALYNTTGVPHPFLNNNDGAGGIVITFASPVYGFSVSAGILADFANSSSLTETFDFAGTSNAVTFPADLLDSNTPLTFVGFSSNTPFTSVSIVDPASGLALENFAYTTAPMSSSSVPEPATLALLGFGFLGATGARKATGYWASKAREG